MNLIPLLISTFHLIINSFFVFIFLAIVIECALLVFRVKQPRIRYLCRILPFIKLLFGLLVAAIGVRELYINFNSFICEQRLQGMIASLLPASTQLALETGKIESLFDAIAVHVPMLWVDILVIGVLLISSAIILKQIYRFILSKSKLVKLLNNTVPFNRQIVNPLLQAQLKKSQAQVLVSSEIEIPFATGKQHIIFPQNLLAELSQEEMEAVTAHELEHLRWRDSTIKCLCRSVCSFFWWIPTAGWRRRLEEVQEHASDSGTLAYGIDSHVLASALLKIVQRVKTSRCEMLICEAISSKSRYVRRLDYLLNSHLTTDNNYLTLCAIGAASYAFFFGSFWIC